MNKTRCKKHHLLVCDCEPRMTEEEYEEYHRKKEARDAL